MLILGIESSCDDTSVALVECNSPTPPNPPSGSGVNFVVISEKTSSQVDVHKKYGGVVPEIAGRMHAENILPVIEEVLKDQERPDVIAVTSGPGLITGLLVGVEAAKSLSYLWDVPLISVNHISGHIHSVLIESKNPHIKFPALCLVVSGGHTELLLMKSHNEFELLGKTRDDAAGETFDKVAKLVGFEYPGGAKISKTAEGGNIKAIDFPRPMLALPKPAKAGEGGINDGYEFSFAGLKTSALYWLRDHTTKNTPTSYKLQAKKLNGFCASFEQAIIDVLVTKTVRAVKEFNPKTIILGGGVSANKKLRNTLHEEITKHFPNSKFQIPNSNYCMDNAAMIAVAGYYKAIKKDFTPWQKIEANPNWRLA
ncbi:MAG: tRNA (adenosine(37)-N6)-threonylcarbamoyltransferase complex transferase subunit TsaD [bacterium]|nr:tRNA (adenosine(37)-N6)-threonylcarbamoyltransferase complex transferase subunit TsaD [bacterium]